VEVIVQRGRRLDREIGGPAGAFSGGDPMYPGAVAARGARTAWREYEFSLEPASRQV